MTVFLFWVMCSIINFNAFVVLIMRLAKVYVSYFAELCQSPWQWRTHWRIVHTIHHTIHEEKGSMVRPTTRYHFDFKESSLKNYQGGEDEWFGGWSRQEDLNLRAWSFIFFCLVLFVFLFLKQVHVLVFFNSCLVFVFYFWLCFWLNLL